MVSRTYRERRALHFSLGAGFLFSVAAMQVACTSDTTYEHQIPTLELRSASFSGDMIPNAYSSCGGQRNVSPQLSWSAPPEGTQSFALVVVDRDSPFGWNFVHWVLYDLPADKHELPESIAKQEQLPDGSHQGRNGYDKIGYVGPCPPGHSFHRYIFRLFALDTKLNLPGGASKKQLMKAIEGHVLASGELTGKFQH
jgi:Raf kinase inhibitor-like YbhB/YbcL family protein